MPAELQKLTPFLMFQKGDAETAPHGFDFTPSTSLFVLCDSDDEQRKLWSALSDGGGVLMPFDDYGFGPFGWTNDRFGVSWQLSLR